MRHWDWMTAAGPPGGRVFALAPLEHEEELPILFRAPGEAVGFTNHIKPMFRKRDRQSMLFAFNLWSYSDVKQHPEGIPGMSSFRSHS
ncbi:MAG: hypothetical protein JO159_14310 [Acidobacteria bacterium]|nr:hypothetical protein [Acidobacteriota bacterium]